jgi:hypothetical protein
MTSSRRGGLLVLAHGVFLMVGIASCYAAMLVPSCLRREPEPVTEPVRGVIDPKPSGKLHDARELPYTFILPSGFTPRLNALRRDARLVPEPWLPHSAHIELERYELAEDVSGMDEKQLRKFAPSVLRRWRVDEPAEVLAAADGSPALEYGERSTHILVFHGRTAVHVHAVSDTQLGLDEDHVLREAARTVAREMRFR